MKKLLLLSLSLCFILVGGVAAAQETSNVAQAVAQDETVSAQSLGVQEPTILPTSPLYFFKNLGRTIQSAITLDPVKKAELRQKFANEKLLELQKLALTTQNTKDIEKATENYQREVENVKNAADKIKQTATQSSEVGKFLDKYIQQQTLQDTILQKLQNQVGTSTMAKIEAAREEHLQKFGEVMQKLEDKNNIQERLRTNLQELPGSDFKDFKNLEILNSLQENAPQAIRDAIQKVSSETLDSLKEKIQTLPTEGLQQFKDYTEQIGGAKETQVEILDSLRTELKNVPTILRTINDAKEAIIERVTREAAPTSCPTVQKPTATSCQNGRTIIKRDENGCIDSFDCVIPAEESSVTVPSLGACTALWDPVCGKDQKTYSNACFAKLAGIEVAKEGICADIGTQIKEQINKIVPQSLIPSTKATQ